jgi:hypothetical protein
LDFIDELKQFSAKTQENLAHIQTEEATKHSIILPFIQLLGYNVFDPNEVIPEFTADVGVKKGEKVDYAILVDKKPSILIEAKNIDDPLKSHETQLYRYFSVTESKFAILTNGIIYKFYSDIQEPNKMDDAPFLEFNLFDIKESTVAELKKFKKESYNVDELFSAATTLKYTNKIKTAFDAEIKDPSEEIVKYFIRDVYSGRATQSAIEKFKPIVKRAFSQYLSELMNDKIKTAIDNTISVETDSAKKTEEEEIPSETDDRKIITTEEELEGYFIVKSICREVADTKRITHKDTLSRFNVLFDNNSWKCICRLYLNGKKKYIGIFKDDKETKLPIDNLEDIYAHKDMIITTVQKYLD